MTGSARICDGRCFVPCITKRVRGLGEGGKAIRPERTLADLFFGSNGGLKMRSKKVLKKWFQRVPKWTPKVDQNR